MALNPMKEESVDNLLAETAVIVGAQSRASKPLMTLNESLNELEVLAKTAGIVVVDRATQTLDRIDPATFVGSGKALEIKELVEETKAKTVIFDDELSPRHQRELSKIFGENIKLLDRSALILDIFAQHANTREGALQVELAQYEYRLPRLTRQWTHLARQGGGGTARGGSGGVGLRGPGETQLEVDKREIGMKISKLKSELENVRAYRRQHRAQRQKTGIPVIALVGYTNAGKSTLLNALTQSDVYVADQLFATLDPTTRRVSLPSGREVLVTDTVGFIQKLPTTLIAAFRATLEEIQEANILLHIVDSTSEYRQAHIETVEDTLAEIDVPNVPRILVYNKSENQTSIPEHSQETDYFAQVSISAQYKQGLDSLLRHIDDALAKSATSARLFVPHERGDILARLFQVAHVISQEHVERGTFVQAHIPQFVYNQFEAFLIES